MAVVVVARRRGVEVGEWELVLLLRTGCATCHECGIGVGPLVATDTLMVLDVELEAKHQLPLLTPGPLLRL